jgi:hypothetical protein
MLQTLLMMRLPYHWNEYSKDYPHAICHIVIDYEIGYSLAQEYAEQWIVRPRVIPKICHHITQVFESARALPIGARLRVITKCHRMTEPLVVYYQTNYLTRQD